MSHQVFIEYRKPLLRFVSGIVTNKETAEDIVQEVFVRFLQREAHVEHVKAWLYRVARNFAWDELRRRGRWGSISIGTTDIAETDKPETEQAKSSDDFFYLHAKDRPIDRRIDDGKIEACIASAIDSLPTDYKRAATLYYLGGLEYPEIQKVTGWPMGTIRSRLHRSRRDLKNQPKLQELYQDA